MAVERLFFALWPPDPVREALAAARAALPVRAGRDTHPLDLHLTLVFVGGVESADRHCIEEAGDDVALAPFALTLDAVCDWPRKGLWIAQPRRPPRALFDLVGQLQQNLLTCGLAPERRPYRPHLTLARKAPPIAPRPLALDWPVDAFVLAVSHNGRRPAYEVVRRWPLPA